jgi:hypothetical protein
MALKQPVQSGSRQMRDGGLQGVEAVVEWQQGVFAEGDSQGFLLFGQHTRARILWPHRGIMDEAALLPLRDRLWIEAVLGR